MAQHACSACGQPLSRYNEGDRCGACIAVDREAPAQLDTAISPSYWFRPDVRHALSQWDWRTVLAAVARDADLSQTRLAELVGLSQAQVSRLMSGRSREPGIRTVLGIVDGLGIPRLLAGLAPKGIDHLSPVAQDGHDDPGATVDPVKRREFGKAAIGVTLAIPLQGTAPDEPVDVTLLDPGDVVADLYQLDDRYGGAAVADIAQRRLDSVLRQMACVSLKPTVETRMDSVIGELATCAAWLYFDAGSPHRARSLDTEALYAAHRANDQGLQVEVLADMCMQAKTAKKYNEAINLAESALTIARGADPRVRALLSMRIAITAAQKNDRHTFTRARRNAWNHLERSRPGNRRAWFQFVDELELAGLEALALLHLGQAAQAATILTDVVAQQHSYVRNKAYYSAVLAETLIAAGRPDDAVATVGEALPMFTEMTSTRTFSRLGKVRAGLTPYLSDPEIAECHAVLGELTATTRWERTRPGHGRGDSPPRRDPRSRGHRQARRRVHGWLRRRPGRRTLHLRAGRIHRAHDAAVAAAGLRPHHRAPRRRRLGGIQLRIPVRGRPLVGGRARGRAPSPPRRAREVRGHRAGDPALGAWASARHQAHG